MSTGPRTSPERDLPRLLAGAGPQGFEGKVFAGNGVTVHGQAVRLLVCDVDGDTVAGVVVDGEARCEGGRTVPRHGAVRLPRNLIDSCIQRFSYDGQRGLIQDVTNNVVIHCRHCDGCWRFSPLDKRRGFDYPLAVLMESMRLCTEAMTHLDGVATQAGLTLRRRLVNDE